MKSSKQRKSSTRSKGSQKKGAASRSPTSRTRRSTAEAPSRSRAKSRPTTGAAKTAAKGAKATAKRAAKKTSRVKKAVSRSGVAKAVRSVSRSRAVKAVTESPVARMLKDAFASGESGRREHVYELLKEFGNVMLVTMEGGGQEARLRARPMAVSKLGEDCSLTFVTGDDSEKVEEARRQPAAHVVAQSSTTFLSLRGSVEIVNDRARIDEAWSPADQVYFPEGKDDPRVCLMVFRPEEAEIWDVSGPRGLKYLFDAARALVMGEEPRHDQAQHDRVDLRTE